MSKIDRGQQGRIVPPCGGTCARVIDMTSAAGQEAAQGDPWDFKDCIIAPVDGSVALFRHLDSDRLVVAAFPDRAADIQRWVAKLRAALDGQGDDPADGIAVRSVPHWDPLNTVDELTALAAELREGTP